jgi:hypothetical protein
MDAMGITVGTGTPQATNWDIVDTKDMLATAWIIQATR